jgi:hypothetical protein
MQGTCDGQRGSNMYFAQVFEDESQGILGEELNDSGDTSATAAWEKSARHIQKGINAKK